MSESRTRAATRGKLESILEQLRRGAVSSNEAAKQMAAVGASMAVIGRLLQPKAVTNQRQKGWVGDGWVG